MLFSCLRNGWRQTILPFYKSRIIIKDEKGAFPMKNLSSARQASIWLLALVMVHFGCDSSSNVIQTDDDATQTLIINRNAQTDDLGTVNEFISEINWLSYLLPFAAVDEAFFDNRFTFASMQSMSDVENWVGIDFGTVKLGDIEVVVLDTTRARASVEVDGELKVVPFHYQTQENAFETDVDTFTGPLLFTSKNSPDLPDISYEIDFPVRNRITNLSRNDEIDPLEDLVISLSRPLNPGESSGLQVITEIDRYANNPFDNKYDGVPHLIIRVAEATDEIVVPSAELQRLQSESSNDFLAIGLKVLEKIDEIELLNPSGGFLQTLDIGVSSSHWVRLRFAR
jgi:hypothetical protein